MSVSSDPAPSPPAEAGAGRSVSWSRRPTAVLAHPLALVLGGVLVAVGMALHLPTMPEEDGITQAIAADPTGWMASHVLMSFGFALVAIAAVASLPLVRGRGARPTVAGVSLTALGAVVLAFSDMAHEAVGFALAETVDMDTSFDIQMAYYERPIVLGLNTGPLLLTLGMIVLGAGLLRSRAVPRWQGIVILLTPVAVNVALQLELPTYLHGLPFLVGMAVLAHMIWRPATGAEGIP